MLRSIVTREFTLSDYEAAVQLWTAVEGVEVAEGDSRDEIARFLRRNPGLSRVAEEEARMVGAALCGHDGRRGWIYHLAVEPRYQGRGIGARLVNECLDGLRRCEIRRAVILVSEMNATGHSFWQRCGWEDIPEARAMGIDL